MFARRRASRALGGGPDSAPEKSRHVAAVHISSRAKNAMKISLQTRRQRGAALLIVMIVLAMLATLAAKNRRSLSHLNEELQRI